MTTPLPKPFHCGGAIDPARQVYVVRAADRQVYELLAQGNHVSLHSGRQAGKTSLMLNLKDRLTADGHLCLDVDMSVIFNGSELIDGLFRLRNRLREQLAAMSKGDLALRELHHMPGDSIADVLRRLLLHLVEVSNKRAPGRRLYLMLDEIDILMRFPADESAQFFLALREFFNRPDSYGDRLILLLVSVLTPNEIILDHPTGGISIGCFRDISLPLFDNCLAVRAQLLEQGFPERQNDSALDAILAQVLGLSGGQPFLTGLLCQELQYAADPTTRFAELASEVLYASRSIAHNHLFGMRKQLADMGERVYAILETYRRVLRGDMLSPSRGGWNAASLENIGLLRLDDDGFYRIANPIYQAHFDEPWVQELMSARETASQGKIFPPVGKRLFKRHIALIQCGGTVGMVTQDGQAGFRGARDVLSNFIRNEVNRVAQVEHFTLYQLDGINMTPTQWLGIAELINSHWDNYDGFVVAQGTDTLAYTASAVAFMLGRVNKPVVFTGAQTTVDVLHGDARDNLLHACYAAAAPDAVLETQICFGNLVLRAVRAQMADGRKYQGFTSPGWPPLAQITEKLLVTHHALLPSAQNRSRFRPHLASEILIIDLAPGLRPEDYQKLLEYRQEAGRPVQGLLITTPGLGNIPSEPPYNFRPLIQEAIAKRIPVLISSQVPINPYTQDQYEVNSIPAQYGAIPAGNLTMAAALTKFSWVIGGVDQEWAIKPRNEANDQAYLDEVKKRMRVDYIGEEQQRPNLPS
ncbi:MAG: asparaginase domain-containing protein [Sulfuricellaceae bacterium]